MTAPTGIHITDTAVWCSASGVVSSVPLYLRDVDGVLLAGGGARHADQETRADQETMDVLRYVDDGTVVVGDRDVHTTDALSALLGETLHDAGIDGGDLVLSHPPHWGPVRTDVLAVAARPHVRDITLVSSAVVAADAAQWLSPCPCPGECRVLVLDRTPHRVTMTTVMCPTDRPDVVECVLLDPAVGTSEHDELLSALTGALTDALVVMAACRIIVHGPPVLVDKADLDAATSLPVLVLEDEDMVSAVVPSLHTDQVADRVPERDAAQDPFGPVRLDGGGPAPTDPGRAPLTGAWLADRTTAAARTRPSGRTVAAGIAVGAVAVLAATAAIVALAGGTPEVDVTASETGPGTSTRPQVTATSALPEATTSVPPARPDRLFRSAGLNVVVPAGWHVEPGTERVEFRPDVPAGMRIVVVSRELAAGTEVDEVMSALSARIAEGDVVGRLGDLRRREDVGSHAALEYAENASDGSTVRWTVTVSPRGQTSIGCQSTPETAESMETVCDEVLESVELD